MAGWSRLTIAELEGTPGRTVRFDGGPHGAGTSFFLVRNDPGQGPGLHWHDYSETWIVLEGSAQFQIEGVTYLASAEEVVVIEPHVHHRFENAGTGKLVMVCIHDSPEILNHWVE